MCHGRGRMRGAVPHAVGLWQGVHDQGAGGLSGRTPKASAPAARTSARLRTHLLLVLQTPCPVLGGRRADPAADVDTVLVLPVWEAGQPGYLYNIAAVIDAKRRLLR